MKENSIEWYELIGDAREDCLTEREEDPRVLDALSRTTDLTWEELDDWYKSL